MLIISLSCFQIFLQEHDCLGTEEDYSVPIDLVCLEAYLNGHLGEVNLVFSNGDCFSESGSRRDHDREECLHAEVACEKNRPDLFSSGCSLEVHPDSRKVLHCYFELVWV